MFLSRTRSTIYLILGAVTAIVSCFLPWSGNELYQLSGFNGSMGNPGTWVLLMVGLVVGLHFLPFKFARRGSNFVSLLLLLLVLSYLKTAFRLEMASPQWGLFLLTLASLGLVVLAFWPKMKT